MGQYYRPVIQNLSNPDNEMDITIYNRDIDGEYTMAKLLEHSYMGNRLMKAICKLLYKNKCKVAWVGDYSEPEELINLGIPSIIANNISSAKGVGLNSVEFDYKGKYLVNHTKGIYMSFDKYLNDEINTSNPYAIIHPLSLLTAVGNGRGGGDYTAAMNLDLVGTWAWNEIEITDEVSPDYSEVIIAFNEEM